MGNGHPIGAVVCTKEVAEKFNNGMEFFSSFGGNPVSCEIANSVLDIMDEEKLQQNAKKVGDYYKKSLTELSSFNEHIGEIRGKGLFLGIEIINRDQSANSMLAQQMGSKLRGAVDVETIRGKHAFFDQIGVTAAQVRSVQKNQVGEVVLCCFSDSAFISSVVNDEPS